MIFNIPVGGQRIVSGTLAFEGRSFRNGNVYRDYSSTNEVREIGVNGNDGANFVTEMRITLPGKVTKLTITLTPESADARYEFYYSLQTAQNSAYYNANATSVTNDGAFQFSQTQGTPVTITINKALAKGTYYVYLWSSKNTGFATLSEILVDESSVAYGE